MVGFAAKMLRGQAPCSRLAVSPTGKKFVQQHFARCCKLPSRLRCTWLRAQDNVSESSKRQRAASRSTSPHRSPFAPKDGTVSHDKFLERRAAITLGRSERQATSDLVDGYGRSIHTSHSSRKLRVAVDVDEVLGQFVYSLNCFCKEEYSKDYSVSDYWVYEFAKIWNCSQDHSNHVVHEFFKSDHFNSGIPVMPGAFETLSRLSEDCELVVVTSRQHVIQNITLDWIDKHFPGLFQEIYFGNHFALSGTSRKKSEICRSIGASVLIDDNPSYAFDCASSGIDVLLYDWRLGYPWSKLNGRSHPLITVVQDWQEVEDNVARLCQKHQQVQI